MSNRLFVIQKDRSQYRIEVKVAGRYSKNVKKHYIRGYSTASDAQQDISRLDLHLKSGRNINTFEKHVTDEMEELLAPPSKRPCSREVKDTDKPSIFQGLQGYVFIRIRRKLNFQYHQYKKELRNENGLTPILSKEDWLQELQMKSQSNFLELEQQLRCQASLTYINQRLRVIRGRKLKNIELINGLRKCIYMGETYTKLREALIEEKNDVIDLTKDGPKFTEESLTRAQSIRITIQCVTVLNMLQEIDQRNNLETSILEGFLSEIGLNSSSISACQLILKDHEIMKKKFRSDNNMNILSDRVRAQTGCVISAKKIREWYHEYLEHENFEEDLRGGWKRDMFLEEYGYALRFQIYMKNERKLTVDIATKELESIIMKDPPKTEKGKTAFDVLRPFSKRTVHRWMIKLGCKYEKAIVSYYTDSHEAEETKKDMKERSENIFHNKLFVLFIFILIT